MKLHLQSPTVSAENLTDSELCFAASQTATDITRYVIAVVAMYVFIAEWMHYCRNFGCYNVRNHFKILTETSLISVASTFTCIAAVGSVIHVKKIISSPLQLESIPWGEIRGFLYSLSMIVCYSVLWFRQRIIYSNPNLLHLSNRMSRLISKYFIYYIVLSGLALVSGIVAIRLLGACTSKCYTTFLWASLTIWPFSIQLTLVSLMVIPLYIHRSTNETCNHKLVTLMKRTAIFTAMCFISDMACLVLHLTICVRWKLPLELNMITNITCVTMIPCNWKERFAPCFKTPRQDLRDSLRKSSGRSLPLGLT